MRHVNPPEIQEEADEPRFVLERREHERVDCNIRAHIHINGAKVCNCIVKNLSEGGARLIVPASCWLPSAFDIVGLVEGLPVKARRVWCDGEEIGVCFVTGE
ncbi:MAG: hypothetical protein BroJett030_01630 [Alphaproteobacteria bacterium]|nr:MAG: hypothetical protein BroJett030_01630 [Alphaproteobacteria bacterium]